MINIFHKRINNKRGFTLTEVLLAITLVGVIAALTVPPAITRFYNRIFDTAYNNEVKNLENMLNNFIASETPGIPSYKIMSDYVKSIRICGTTGEYCFAQKYYEYVDKVKTDYTPHFVGECAILQNGMSLCLNNDGAQDDLEKTGKIYKEKIYKLSGIIDLNGIKRPNVYGMDLRDFEITAKGTNTYTQRTVGEIITWESNTCETADKECCTTDSEFFENHRSECCAPETMYAGEVKCNGD